MHIHKIAKDKHNEFLSQNRKDPITGDLISVDDEVVFCASCKSVFLLDTWMYLNGNHCEQSETLKGFPSSSVLNLKAEETILFYQALLFHSRGQDKIPRKVKKAPWVHKQNKISPYQTLFNNSFIDTFKIILWIIGGFLFFSYDSPFIVLAFLLTFIFSILESIHDWYFGSKDTSVYKIFKNNHFYITNKLVGFSEAYGINYYTLKVEHIEKIVFHEGNNLFDATYCKIYYQKNGKQELLKFNLPVNTFQNSISFFNSLKSLSSSTHLPIYIESKDKSTLYHLQKTIAEGNTNFRLEN